MRVRRAVAVGLWSVAMVGGGVWLERSYQRHLASSVSSSASSSGPVCCAEPQQSDLNREKLLSELRAVVGEANVHYLNTDATYLHAHQGARITNDGSAAAVVSPTSLREALALVEVCVANDAVIVPQGANTGLTGGTSPERLERPIVILNTRKLKKIIPVGDEAILCFAGAGIKDASDVAASLGKESHSILGSVFLNPSCGAGCAYGSGGTQLRKGAVYTEKLLYIRVDENGKAVVCDTLGLDRTGQDEHEDILTFLDKRASSETLTFDPKQRKSAPTHDSLYATSVCQQSERKVARYNADTRGPLPLRSEGHCLILASVHTLFPKCKSSQTIWVSCRDFQSALKVRAACLNNPDDLPSSLEYMNRDAIMVIDRAGRGLCFLASMFGIGKQLTTAWDAKQTVEGLPVPFADVAVEKLAYWGALFLPNPLPAAVRDAAFQFDHHLIITNDDYDGNAARLEKRLREALQHDPNVVVHYCTNPEAQQIKFFRFAAAPAFRTYAVGRGLQQLSVDYALPKSHKRMPNVTAPPSAAELSVVVQMRYSHFGCCVVHEDVAIGPDGDVKATKKALLQEVSKMGGKFPAEHGHGTEYAAPPELVARWKELDPLNVFNAGVGQTSKLKRWQ